MGNVALGKRVEENIRYPEEVTNGIINGYGRKGFAQINCPGYLTIDLGQSFIIFSIRILIWDDLGLGRGPRSRIRCKYRLLSSIDHKNWHVLFDTGVEEYNGWQVFKFTDGLTARYIRLHALSSSLDHHFRIVQVEVYDENPPIIDAEVVLEKSVSTIELSESELMDGLPLVTKVENIINKIEALIKSTNFINPEPFKELVAQLREQVIDVASIEKNMVSIRKEIVNPVKNDLESTGKISKWSLYIGIIGGIIGIISMGLTIYTIIKPYWYAN